MEFGKRIEPKLCRNEVAVAILETNEEASKSERSKSLEGYESGLYSFSKYVPVKPPNFEKRKKNTEISIPCSLDLTHLSTNFNKSMKSPAQSVTRRRSIAQSAYSKPKSRLIESLHPNKRKLVDESTEMDLTSSTFRSSPIIASSSNKFKAYSDTQIAKTAPITPKPTTPITPKSPLVTSFVEEDDDDDDDDDDGNDDNDIYQTQHLHVVDEKKRGKKLKLMLIIELIAFVCLMGLLIASLTIPVMRNWIIWCSKLWKWCVLVLVIFCGRLVTDWCCKVLVFLIERNYFMKKKVLYFVYSLKICIRLLIWLGLILMAWALLINQAVRSENATEIFNLIARGLASSLIGVAMWTIKTLLVKILASSFHLKTFFDKIQESLFYQYVIQMLSGPSLIEYTQGGDSKKSSGRLSFRSVKNGRKIEKEEVIDVEKLHKMKKEKISAWTMGGLIQLVRTSGLYSIYDALDQSVDEERGDQNEKKITSEWEAKAAAYRIFKNVAKHGSKYIDEEDLLRFLNIEEVENVLPLFEGSVHTGKIKKICFCNWVVNVYNERKYLAHSLNDTKTAIDELNKIVSAIVLVIVVVVWLLLMGIATTKVLIFISSHLLLLAFMFGSTTMAVFEGLVFVFIMHPFDVGDRCVIDGVQMVVEEMNILTTIFLRCDNVKVFYPNSVLASKPIGNYNRSPEMNDSVEFVVDVSTSIDTIVALEANIQQYLESRPQFWNPNHSVRIKEIEEINKMKVGVYVTHTINFQNYEEKSNRRSELVFEIKKLFDELGIKYCLLP